MKVYIAKTKYVGKGIFALKPIKKDDVIFIVKGKIVKSGFGPQENKHPNMIGYNNKAWIMPFKSNPLYYLNHSCNPNAGIKGKVTFVAMKPIKKDEEIMLDYSIAEEDPAWSMKCRCGNRNCCKVIRSIQFLDRNLFDKYKIYIPKYLRILYLKYHKL